MHVAAGARGMRLAMRQRIASPASADAPRMAIASPVRSTAPAAEPQPLGMEVHTRLVNVAGRQRMLSQRIALMALLAAQGDVAARQQGREALDLFERSHRLLSQGGDGLPAPEAAALREAFFGAAGADAPVLGFIQLARRVFDHAAPADLARLVAQAGPVLQGLIALTGVYEARAQHDSQRLRERRTALIGAIQRVAGEARVVSMNARVAAARAGAGGREFAVVAARLLEISDEVESLARRAIADR